MGSSPSETTIGIVGLGYVGLTLAVVLAESGFSVIGIEKRKDVVDLTNTGTPHFSETGLTEALGRVVRSGSLVATDAPNATKPCDVYIITVGTPLNADGAPRLDMIEAASRQVASSMKDGALVILRSTVKIGTARNVVTPILEASGKKFDIAMCPERTLEGRALQELRELPQIVGADTQAVRDRAASIFLRLTKTIVQVAKLETAEIVKLVDNTYRDVQFGFANEVARLCEVFDVNAYEVITSGKLGYKRTNVPLPGPVGGPCLEKDPHILFQSARECGIELEITRASRAVNERQPGETISFVVTEMEKRGFGHGAKIAVLGMAFKGVPETDDLRGSMALKILAAFKAARPDGDFYVFDPVIDTNVLQQHVPETIACATVDEAIKDASVVVIANNHPMFSGMSPLSMYERMAPNAILYDYWNHFSNLSEHELGDAYFAVGNVKRSLA